MAYSHLGKKEILRCCTSLSLGKKCNGMFSGDIILGENTKLR